MQITKRPNCRSLGSNRNSMKIRFIHKIQYSRQCYMTLVVLHFLMLESQPVNHRLKDQHIFSGFAHTSFHCFWRKSRQKTFTFLDIFNKKSCKKCKETLNSISERLILALQSCHIPCCGVSVSSFCVPFWSISSSGYAHIEVWYGAFQALKRAITCTQVVLFVWWRNWSWI